MTETIIQLFKRCAAVVGDLPKKGKNEIKKLQADRAEGAGLMETAPESSCWMLAPDNKPPIGKAKNGTETPH
ncbi:hypothetical protein UPYG_G00105510 [Umbra pygmaea]|uniref:Phage protein n=1 Tax=Umbra pygmaea TaxID=75934 RepID=A0ABD0X1Y6_UMBPY